MIDNDNSEVEVVKNIEYKVMMIKLILCSFVAELLMTWIVLGSCVEQQSPVIAVARDK